MNPDMIPENLKEALRNAESHFCEYRCEYEPVTNSVRIVIRHKLTNAVINFKISGHMLYNNSPDVLHNIMLIDKFVADQFVKIPYTKIPDVVDNNLQVHYNELDAFLPGVGIPIDKTLFELYNVVRSKIKERGNFKIDIEKFVDVMIQLGIIIPNEEDEEIPW